MGKKTKVVIDTNVIVSAFGWGGVPEEVLSLAETGRIINFTSAELLAELQRVIMYSRLPFSAASRIEIMEIIFCISHISQPSELINVIKQDAADNRVLECAVSAGGEFIISGDKHLLDLGSFSGIRIVAPDEFMKIIGIKL